MLEPAPEGMPKDGLSRRGMLTLSMAALLSGTYGAYALVVNPLVDPPAIDPARRPALLPPPPPPPENVRMAEAHLASQPWTAEANYQLRLADAFVYADEWEPVDEGRAIRFTPFAAVWRPDGRDPDEPPITIVSESAYLNFSDTFEITNPNPGRVIGGALQGNVQVRGPEGLEVSGRNFMFSEAALRVWSDNPVQFAYGPHRGDAIGLQAELIPLENPGPRDSLAVSGLQSVRLRRRVAMDLLFEQEQESGENPQALASGVTSGGEPVHVRVRSAGSFDFFIETNRATFQDNVRVYRPTGPGNFDSLQCDLLTLLFETEDPQDNSHEKFQGISTRLDFQRLRAQGRTVVLRSQENNLRAYMTDLVYDAETKAAVLRDGEFVKVVQEAGELQAPEITLAHDEEGKVLSALCRGAGQLKYHDPETGTLQLAAQWAGRLWKYPDPHGNFDIIQLERQALVRQPEQKMGLAADFIKLWVDPQGEVRTGGESDGTTDGAETVRLKRMLARQKVALVSPDLHAETERLEVWFQEEASPRPSPTTPVGRKAKEGLQPVVHRVDSAGGGTEQNGPLKPEEPIHVTADLIRVRAVQGDQQQDAQVAEIWTKGNVRVTQEHGTGEDPLELTGDHLHVQNRSEHDQVLHVFGRPAHIRDRGVHIEGREIQMDRAGNQASVNGAGLLELPVNNTLEGEPLDQPHLLEVWWKEQMTFDGESARFYGDVRSVLGDSRMHCQQMQVLLTKKFSFTEEARQEDVDIHRVLCQEGVQFDSYEYADNKLVEIRRGWFSEFSLNQQTGRTEAEGPGWIAFWRRGSGKRAALAPAATVQANKPLQSEIADWEYTRIDFSGRTEGSLKQRNTKFHDRVRIVYGPVQRPLATINVDDLPRDGGWMGCQTLWLTQSGDAEERHIELEASGNAELEGRTFNARADFINYDESKGLYILSSQGNRKATIWHQKEIGADFSEVNAQRMEFIPSRNQLKFDRATGLDGVR